MVKVGAGRPGSELAVFAWPTRRAAGELTQVRLRYPGVMAARPLLSFGANVEVLSPESVRADLAEVAAEVVASYSNVRLGTE